MEVDEGSDQNSDIMPHWMAAYARLKNEFTDDEKYHNLMAWLIYGFAAIFMTKTWFMYVQNEKCVAVVMHLLRY